MGLISRVSSRTYRFKKYKKIQPKCRTIRKMERLLMHLKKTTSESRSAPRTPSLSTKLATRSLAVPRLSTPEVLTRAAPSRSRDLDLCQPADFESPPERHHAVKVQRPGTDIRCEFTSASSSSSAARLRSSTSPKFSLSQVYTLSSLSQRTKSGNRRLTT